MIVLSVLTNGILNTLITSVMIPILHVKELNHQRLRNLPKFSQLVSGRAKIQIQVVGSNLCYVCYLSD